MPVGGPSVQMGGKVKNIQGIGLSSKRRRQSTFSASSICKGELLPVMAAMDIECCTLFNSKVE